jgi:pimeloyl-ACP methyl ester carboxylesterase
VIRIETSDLAEFSNEPKSKGEIEVNNGRARNPGSYKTATSPKFSWKAKAFLGVSAAVLTATALAPTQSFALKLKKPKPKTPTTKGAPVATNPAAAPAPTANPAPVSPESTGVPKAASTLKWVPCGKLQCSELSVPVNYSVPTGPKIKIALNMKPATNPSARIGSVLTNPGGPGGSGIRLVEERSDMLTDQAGVKYDLIGFDPRGLGKSSELPCASAQTRSATSARSYLTDVKENCKNRAPDLLASMSTANVARDMDMIRAALGEEKLNYIGISYGTYLGLVYADLFPNRVGKFVIDSAVDPAKRAIELQVGQFTQYERNLKAFLDRCTAPTCSFADADIMKRYERLLTQLERKTLISGNYGVHRRTVETVMIFLPERAGGEALLRRFLSGLEVGDASAIYEVIKVLDDRLPDPADLDDGVDSDAVYFAIACSEGFHPSASPDLTDFVRLVTANAPHFLLYAQGRAGEACGFWGQKVETRPQPVYKPGVPPMLFVGSLNDRTTPIEWTQTVATKWPGSAMLKVVGYKHGAVPDIACAKTAASAFISDGKLPADGSTCG